MSAFGAPSDSKIRGCHVGFDPKPSCQSGSYLFGAVPQEMQLVLLFLEDHRTKIA